MSEKNSQLIKKYKKKNTKLNQQVQQLKQQIQQLTVINEYDKYNDYLVNQLKLDDIKSTSSVYISGTSNKERLKTTLDLLNNYVNGSNKLNLLIISPRNHSIFKKLYPSATVKTKFSTNDIKKYLEQREIPTPNDTKWCVILDECFSNFTDIVNDYVCNLFEMNKVTYIERIKYPNIKIIVTNKECNGYPYLKKRIDFVVLLKNTNIKIQHNYYTAYGQMFLTFDLFHKFFSAITNKYDCMIINTDVYRKDLSNYVYGLNIRKYDNIRDDYDSDSEQYDDKNLRDNDSDSDIEQSDDKNINSDDENTSE